MCHRAIIRVTPPCMTPATHAGYFHQLSQDILHALYLPIFLPRWMNELCANWIVRLSQTWQLHVGITYKIRNSTRYMLQCYFTPSTLAWSLHISRILHVRSIQHTKRFLFHPIKSLLYQNEGRIRSKRNYLAFVYGEWCLSTRLATMMVPFGFVGSMAFRHHGSCRR